MNLMMPPKLLKLYGAIYQCMHCASALDENGVLPFVRPGPHQTIPVSHFGDIEKAKIWLVGTNPKGRRRDSNVGFLPEGFSARSALTDVQVQEVFDHFSKYFQRGCPDSFFDHWLDALDGLELCGVPQTWTGGGFCCVDLVKCPTAKGWRSVVRGPDKKLIYGCFEEGDEDGRRYLRQQVDLHEPRVLIFAAGLGARAYYAENNRDNTATALRRSWPKEIAITGIWSVLNPPRLSIGLGADAEIKKVRADALRAAIQCTIASWENAHPPH